MNTMPRKPLYKLKPIIAEESIGERLGRIRKSRGLTQIELAERVGIKQALCSAYERGRLRLSAEMLAQFALVLKASSDEILGISKPPAAEKADRRLLKRLRKIAALTPSQKKVLFSNIDMYLDGALARKTSGPAENGHEGISP